MTNFFSWRSAFKKSDIPSTTKLVLFCISTYMNDDGKGAFPSIQTLMADSSLSNKAVIKHVKLAEEMGFIKVSKLGLAGQKWRLNNYEIAFPEPVKVVNEVHFDNSEGGEPQSKGGEPQSKGGEPQGIKVVNEVHTITPMNSPRITSIEKTNKKENQLSIAKPKQELAQNTELESFNLALNQYSALAEKYGLRIPRMVSPTNATKLRKTIKMLEDMGSDWVEYLRIIARSPHLLGKNDRGWKATFDWIINPRNFEKIINGNYEQDRPQQKPMETEKWHKRLSGLKERNFWIDGWGEKPGIEGCQVPPEVLQQFGYEVVT